MEIHLFSTNITTPAIRPICSLALLFAIVLLSACSSNDAYLDAQTLPPVVVPDNLDKQALGQIYAIPEGDGRLATGEFAEPLPPTLSSRQAITEPRVQTFQNKSWLVVPKEASATWSQLLIFLQSRRVLSLKQDPGAATIETDWVTETAEYNQGLRYRLRLEAGFQPDLTEIHAINISGKANSSIPASTQWPEVSENRTHETWFLKEIARAISNQQTLGDSLIASAISFPPKGVSTSLDGEPIVELLVSEERAYSVLLNSLNNSQYVTYDHSESGGVIYFDEGSQQEKKTLTKKVTGFIYDLATVQFLKNDSAYPLSDVLANLPNEERVTQLFPAVSQRKETKKLSGVPGYLLVLRKVEENKQQLFLRDGYGRPLPSVKAKILLDSIRKQLH
ncbi:MAG: outer membrane protein assembly factor BamC [Granulosicoccus sp.]|jgi:outer membrane protein assembly factor BamC